MTERTTITEKENERKINEQVKLKQKEKTNE
jgi:hypothetical protein